MSGDVPVRFCERLGVKLPRATHLVIIFEHERDARRVLDVLPKRLAKYGLTLHPEKTRLIDFQRPDRRTPASLDANGDASSRPGTFDLLGFTHYWAMSRKGYWVVKQKTAADRFRRTLKRIADWCRRYRHEPVREQWTALRRKLLGLLAGLDTEPSSPIPFVRKVRRERADELFWFPSVES